MIKSIRKEVVSEIVEYHKIERKKAEQAVDLARANITEQLNNEVAQGNFSGIKHLLDCPSADQQHERLETIISPYINDLRDVLQLSPSTATAIGHYVIPFIFEKLSKKTNNASFDKGSILDLIGVDHMDEVSRQAGEKPGGFFGDNRS